MNNEDAVKWLEDDFDANFHFRRLRSYYRRQMFTLKEDYHKENDKYWATNGEAASWPEPSAYHLLDRD